MTAPPKKIRVGTSVYSCDVVEHFPRGEEFDGHYGMTNVVTEQIFIQVNQGEGQMKDTTCHEVLHAIVNRAGIRLSDADEEAMIGKLVPWLLLVIQDNPKLVAYLQEKVK